MKNVLILGAIAAAATLAQAGDVHPGIIWGSGNANGNYTVNTASNVEVGIRAKLPYVGTTHYDGGNTYTYSAGETWNFDWSINTDVDGTSGLNLGDFTYELSMFKLGADGTNPADAVTFDLINGVDPNHGVSWYDHSFGDNSTTEATDTVGDAGNYASLVANNNVAQNSWRYIWYSQTGSALEGYDVNAVGSYIVRLTVLDGMGAEVVTTDINVNIVPLPTAAFAGLGLLGALGGVRVIRRR